MCRTENRLRNFELRLQAWSSDVGPVCDLCSPRVRDHEISVAQVGSLTPTALAANTNTQNTQIRPVLQAQSSDLFVPSDSWEQTERRGERICKGAKIHRDWKANYHLQQQQRWCNSSDIIQPSTNQSLVLKTNCHGFWPINMLLPIIILNSWLQERFSSRTILKYC